jgi:hypothetical protein
MNARMMLYFSLKKFVSFSRDKTQSFFTRERERRTKMGVWSSRALRNFSHKVYTLDFSLANVVQDGFQVRGTSIFIDVK